MPNAQESLIHEATSLFRLVDSVDRFVAEHQSSYTYTHATESFLGRVRTVAANTKKRVSDIVQRPTATPEENHQQYSDLIIEKDRWKILHTYIKPASDAHTLALPVPLLRLAAGDLRSVKGIAGAELVALLTHELMYFQNLTSLKDLDDLIFVELPYSQGPGFFTNLIIYHELGHYVFERMSDAETTQPSFTELAQVMEASFDDELGKQITTGSTKAWAKRVLNIWAREIFCDLFAVRFLGPAFTFALIDILSLLGLMREGTEVTFDDEHPAPALRFREQIEQLKRDDWWDTVASLPSDHISFSLNLASKPTSDYEFVFSHAGVSGFIEAFLKITRHIHTLIEAITPDPREIAQDFRNRRVEIEQCLLEGVVPSHLLRQGRNESPTPVSIINAAYSFYLTSMPKLMAKLIHQEPLDLKQRCELTAKLEGWTLKALEDHQLYTDQRKGY